MLLYLYKKGEEKRNTLELHGIETYSPEIQTFVREIFPAGAAKAANILELPFFISSLSLNSMIQILLDIPMAPEPRY